jgi:hypothetical protein
MESSGTACPTAPVAYNVCSDAFAAQGRSRRQYFLGRRRAVGGDAARNARIVIQCIAQEDRTPSGHSSNRLFTTAGTPATKEAGGTSFVTTAPAATNAALPIVTPPSITTRAPIQHPSSTTMGRAVPTPARLLAPPNSCVPVIKLTSGPMSQSRPIATGASKCVYTMKPGLSQLSRPIRSVPRP